MSKLLDAAEAALKRRADLNGDQKVDMQDVEVAMSQVRAAAGELAEEEMHKHPTGTLVFVAVVVAVIAFAIGYLFG